MAITTGPALVDAIRQLLIEGHYPPDKPLSELGLAKIFEVSRTPVREALKQLQVEGWLEVRPRVGTFVREPSLRQVAELYEIKEVLEGLAARLVAGRGDIPEFLHLEANIEASKRAVKRHDSRTYAELVLQFHTILIDAADHRELSEQYRTLMRRLQYQRLVLRTFQARSERMEASIAEHEDVLRRIVEKNRFGAEDAMRQHVRTTSREALRESAVPQA